MTEEKLTNDEKMYLQKLFFEHHERINRKLDEELLILSKYKGELARNYEKAAANQNTLSGLMKDILDRQDELIGMGNQLGNMVLRLERFFLNDEAPKEPKVGRK